MVVRRKTGALIGVRVTIVVSRRASYTYGAVTLSDARPAAGRAFTVSARIRGAMMVDAIKMRYALVIAGLVAAFYCLASISIGRMPFTLAPVWWIAIWPSRQVSVYTWFGVLNAAGAMFAAIPVSFM